MGVYQGKKSKQALIKIGLCENFTEKLLEDTKI